MNMGTELDRIVRFYFSEMDAVRFPVVARTPTGTAVA